MIYKMTLKDSVDTMTFNLLETPIVDKDIEGAVDNVTLDGNQYTDYLYLKKQYIQKWAIMCPDGYDELRGFYTRQFENGEVPSYRVYYGANVTRDYTLNGDYFQFNAEGIETGMTLSQLLGNAEQTNYSGKNLLNTNNLTTRSSGGITTTWSNNVGTASGTTTATSFIATDTVSASIPAGTYTFSVQTAIAYRMVIALYNSDTSSWVNDYTMSANQRTITFTTNFTASSWRIGVGSIPTGTTISNLKIDRPMLESGSSASDYEPYVGGIPSPNPDYPQDIQVVTGDSTVVICGKNSLSAPQDYTEDRDGLVFTCTGGIYNIRGNASSGNVTADHDITQPYTIRAGDYWHLCNDFTDTHIQIALVFTDGNIRNYSPSVVNRIESLSAYAGKTVSKIRFYYNSGYSINGNIKPMILNGVSTATGFIPYQGQSYEVNLGKNLLGGYTYDYGASGATATYHEDGTLTMTGTATATTWSTGTNFAFTRGLGVTLPAGTYTFTAVGGHEAQLVSVLTDGTGEVANAVISTGDGSATFTTTAERFFYARLRVLAGATDYTCKFMLERGSIPTSYAPYFTPIELAKIPNTDYRDKILYDKDDGKWYIEKQVEKVVFDGSENITLHGTVDSIVGVRLPVPNNALHNTVVLCDYFHYVPFGVYYGADGNRTYGTITTHNTTDINTLYASSPNSAITDVAGFKTWLGTHNITVYYALATPTTTEITDQTLLYQLNFLASLYKGANNISLTGTGAQGEMEVFIRDVMSVETDVVPEVPVRLTLTDDGVINACGCRRNVQLTMRETTE